MTRTVWTNPSGTKPQKQMLTGGSHVNKQQYSRVIPIRSRLLPNTTQSKQAVQCTGICAQQPPPTAVISN